MPQAKHAEVVMGVIHNLAKLAEELEDIGAADASSVVDEALKVLVNNMKTASQPDEVYLEEEDITESFEDDESVSGREEGMGSRTERTPQDPEDELSAQPKQDDTPEGLGMGNFGHQPGSNLIEDKLDRLSPEDQELLKGLLGKLR